MADPKALGREILEDLEATGVDLWAKVAEDLKPILAGVVANVGELSALLITDPANTDRYQQALAHAYNAMLSEIARAASLSDRALREFLGRITFRVAAFAVTLL